MNPTQAAAFIAAQTAMLLVELEAMKAYDRVHPDTPYIEQAYLDLYAKYECVLGFNSVINTYQEAARNG